MTSAHASATADRSFMTVALRLARRGIGRTGENPSVGCVLVRDGEIVAAARTADGGRPHAEAQALAVAGDRARGATAYVTLEPCAHWGRTPPCAEGLIQAGIARVVVAVEDPDPRVDGGGLAMLRKAGIEVLTDVDRVAAEAVLSGYLKRRLAGRPEVTLKLATSLDGRIATATGSSRWITGAEARARGHMMRARHDAILVGAGTVRADDPDLTCRLPGLEGQSPVRVVMDGELRMDQGCRLVMTASETPTWLVCRENVPEERQTLYRRRDVTVLPVAGGASGVVDPDATLAALAGRGINRVLIEGGARIAAAFLKADLIDQIALFRAPIAIGGDGRASLDGLDVVKPDAAPRFETVALERIGTDTLETLRRRT